MILPSGVDPRGGTRAQDVHSLRDNRQVQRELQVLPALNLVPPVPTLGWGNHPLGD